MRLIAINIFRIMTLFILCTMYGRAFDYAVKIIETIIEEKAEYNVGSSRQTLESSKVCQGSDSDRWGRCEEAVEINYCRLLEVRMNPRKLIGRAKAYEIKEKDEDKERVVACECPTKPIPIYLSDNVKQENHVHVIVVQPKGKGNLGNFVNKYTKKVFSNKERHSPIMRDESGNRPSVERSSMMKNKHVSFKEHDSSSGINDESSPEDRRDKGHMENRSSSQSGLNKDESNFDGISGSNNDKLNADRKPIKSRSSNWDKSVSGDDNRRENSNERKDNKISEDFRPPDIANWSQSVNDQVYKDILASDKISVSSSTGVVETDGRPLKSRSSIRDSRSVSGRDRSSNEWRNSSKSSQIDHVAGSSERRKSEHAANPGIAVVRDQPDSYEVHKDILSPSKISASPNTASKPEIDRQSLRSRSSLRGKSISGGDGGEKLSERNDSKSHSHNDYAVRDFQQRRSEHVADDPESARVHNLTQPGNDKVRRDIHPSNKMSGSSHTGKRPEVDRQPLRSRSSLSGRSVSGEDKDKSLNERKDGKSSHKDHAPASASKVVDNLNVNQESSNSSRRRAGTQSRGIGGLRGQSVTAGSFDESPDTSSDEDQGLLGSGNVRVRRNHL